MHTGISSLVLMMGGAMADASNRDGSMTNNFYAPVGNVAGSAQDDASQNYNAGGEAIAPSQGNGKLVQADGEGLLTKMLGPAAIQVGKLGKLKTLCWSLECFNATWGRASEILQKLGIDPQPIKLKLVKELIDGATAEEEPELQALWANLIATTAATGETHPSFADILSKLTAADARCLQEFERRGFPASSDGSDNQASLDNLVRLGLCEKRIKLQSKEQSRLRGLTGSPWRLASPPGPGGLGALHDEPYRLMERLVITDLGHRFLDAVQGPQVSE